MKILRDTNVRRALRDKQRGFIMNPYAFAAAGATDPDFASVSLLMNCESTNGSPVFIDSSSYGHTLTANGNVQHDTSVKPFGTSSALFDGTGDYISAPAHTSLNLGTGAFTIEFFTRLSTNPRDFLTLYNGGTTKVELYYASNAIGFYEADSGANHASVGTPPPTNTWCHIAYCRSGTSLRIFLDGVQINGAYTYASSMPSGCTWDFGRGFAGAGRDMLGNQKGLRVTTVARYTSNFTAPTALFPTS